jgi:hypothetical protein
MAVSCVRREESEMSKLIRMVLLAASLMSVLGAMSAAAGAVTWTSTGDTSFTATAGASTLSVTGVALVWTGAHMTGTTGPSPFVGAIWPALSGTWSITGFRIGLSRVTMDCRWQLTALSQLGGATNGTVDLACSEYGEGREFCRIEGQTAGTYVNPAGGFGTMTLTHASSLRTTDGADNTCFLGAGEAITVTTIPFRLTSATGGASSPHTGPVFSRD